MPFAHFIFLMNINVIITTKNRFVIGKWCTMDVYMKLNQDHLCLFLLTRCDFKIYYGKITCFQSVKLPVPNFCWKSSTKYWVNVVIITQMITFIAMVLPIQKSLQSNSMCNSQVHSQIKKFLRYIFRLRLFFVLPLSAPTKCFTMNKCVKGNEFIQVEILKLGRHLIIHGWFFS